MLNKITIIVLSGLVIFQFIQRQFLDEDPVIPEYYIKQAEESLEREATYGKRLDLHDNKFNKMRYEIYYKDSIVDNSSGAALDSLFGEFWNATGFH